MTNSHFLTAAGCDKAALSGARHSHYHDEDGIGRRTNASREREKALSTLLNLEDVKASCHDVESSAVMSSNFKNSAACDGYLELTMRPRYSPGQVFWGLERREQVGKTADNMELSRAPR
jgi:hypothetical protein